MEKGNEGGENEEQANKLNRLLRQKGAAPACLPPIALTLRFSLSLSSFDSPSLSFFLSIFASPNKHHIILRDVITTASLNQHNAF